MTLTPADVHNVAFKKPPIGKRGYDEDEVDAFLDLVEAELARLIEENAELKRQVAEVDAGGGRRGEQTGPQQQVGAQQAYAAPEPQPVPIQQAAPSPDGHLTDHDKASRVLALASETADRHLSEARAEADRLLTEARTSGDQSLSEARAKAEQLLSDAKTRSDALLGEARTRAEAVEREARTKAAQLSQDAERKHVEIIGGLEERKNTLEREVEQLRTYEREYRTRLKTFLESQLRDLDRGSAEPANARGSNAHVPQAAPAGSPVANQAGVYGAPQAGPGRGGA